MNLQLQDCRSRLQCHNNVYGFVYKNIIVSVLFESTQLYWAVFCVAKQTKQAAFAAAFQAGYYHYYCLLLCDSGDGGDGGGDDEQ